MAKKRGNNEGSITRRPDGRWMAQVTIGRDAATGKPKRATFYGKTRQEVADKLTKALREKQQGTFVAPHKMTLGEWLDTWLWEYKKLRIRPDYLRYPWCSKSPRRSIPGGPSRCQRSVWPHSDTNGRSRLRSG